MSMLKKKHLAKILSGLDGYKNPKPELEQYETPGDTAAEMIWMADLRGKLKEKVVADLGCGTGILSVGSAFLGARKVYAIDIDEEAVEIARANATRLNVLDKIEFLVMDVREFDRKVDTVIMNPPFGCQTRNADRPFLEKAFEISSDVFSLHLAKEDVERFLKRFSAEHGFEMMIIGKSRFDIPAKFFFHKSRLVKIDIHIIHFKRRGNV